MGQPAEPAIEETYAKHIENIKAALRLQDYETACLEAEACIALQPGWHSGWRALIEASAKSARPIQTVLDIYEEADQRGRLDKKARLQQAFHVLNGFIRRIRDGDLAYRPAPLDPMLASIADTKSASGNTPLQKLGRLFAANDVLIKPQAAFSAGQYFANLDAVWQCSSEEAQRFTEQLLARLFALAEPSQPRIETRFCGIHFLVGLFSQTAVYNTSTVAEIAVTSISLLSEYQKLNPEALKARNFANLIRQADVAATKRDYEAAATLYADVFLRGTYKLALDRIIECGQEQEDHGWTEQRLKSVAETLGTEPDNYLRLYHLSVALAELRREDKNTYSAARLQAEDYLIGALHKDRQQSDLWAELIDIQLARGDFETAQALLETYEADCPDTWGLSLAKATYAQHTNQLDAALEHVQAAAAHPDINPVIANLKLIDIHLAQGRYSQAEQQHQNVRLQTSDHSGAKRRALQILISLGCPGLAVQAYEDGWSDPPAPEIQKDVAAYAPCRRITERVLSHDGTGTQYSSPVAPLVESLRPDPGHWVIFTSEELSEAYISRLTTERRPDVGVVYIAPPEDAQGASCPPLASATAIAIRAPDIINMATHSKISTFADLLAQACSVLKAQYVPPVLPRHTRKPPPSRPLMQQTGKPIVSTHQPEKPNERRDTRQSIKPAPGLVSDQLMDETFCFLEFAKPHWEELFSALLAFDRLDRDEHMLDWLISQGKTDDTVRSCQAQLRDLRHGDDASDRAT